MKNFKKLYLILFFGFIFLYLKKIKYYTEFKVCLCTIGKNENLYAREFVEFYKKKGVNKIFIYDNNEKDGEKFDILLNDYIDKEFVDIIDFRGIQAPQLKAMEDCRKKNFRNFDWLIFYDMDEFIFLRNYSNINDFLKQKIFYKCQRIQLNWIFHTDNNLLYYDNRSLAERFPQKYKQWSGIKIGGSAGIKSILRGNINIEINNVHYLNSKLISCDGFGKIKEVQGISTNESDHYYYYIDHYWSKSTEEFINKLVRGDVALGNIYPYNGKIDIYFAINDITLNKINYIENKTKYNLTKFKLMVMKGINSLNNTFNNKII